jgi:SAM-dependent methyltransferase
MRVRFEELIGSLHHRFVHLSRVEVLAKHLAEMIPREAESILDVGCGDGLVDRAILARRRDLSIEGADLFPRREALIPVRSFDGRTIPYADKSFDAVMFIDVLHHTVSAVSLLREAGRVARRCVLIKDHYADGLRGRLILRLMDLVGNAGQSFAWLGDYWPQERWQQTFKELNLSVIENRTRLGLYPAPASWVFERSYHFIAKVGLHA